MPELIAHSRCFLPKVKGGQKNGSVMGEVEVRKQFTVNLSDTPVWIADDLVFPGEIPRQFAFERADPGKRRILHPNGTRAPDQLPGDTALAFRSDNGLVILTGCSHAGICNITGYARAVCREQRVAGIIGDLHLLSLTPEQLKKAGEYLQDLHINALHACHCTSHASKIALAEYCPVQETCVGIIHVW